MAMIATQTINAYALRNGSDMERGRSDGRVGSPINRDDQSSPRNAEFPRSASYTYLPAAKESYNTSPAMVTIKGSFSEADLIAPADEVMDISPPDSSGWTTPDDSLPVEQKVPADQARDLLAELQRSPKISVIHQNNQNKGTDDDRSSFQSSHRRPSTTSTSAESLQTASTTSTTPIPTRPRPSASSSYSKRANRRSWYGSSPSTSSRSPSPSKQDVVVGPPVTGVQGAPTPPPVGAVSHKRSLIRRRGTSKSVKEGKEARTTKTSSADNTSDERPVSRGSSILRRKSSSSRISALFKAGAKDESGWSIPPIPRVPSFPKSFSTDRLPHFRSEPDRAAPMPRLVANNRIPSGGLTMPRKKDELWTVFRTLDADYTKFVSKSVAFKANVVRTALLPFLRMYNAHPSNKTLRPEDLDRRANILNKWWTGLIEMLHGRNNQSISGTDRPAILDGISGIMERPEWRLSPSPFCPLDQRVDAGLASRNRSASSLSSNASEFLAESVHHNVRNIFIQNLSAQMAFVVDKMSLRNASASLVTFCGKACAFAFMFVPGMADVLVRLWDLPMDTLRRVLQENEVGKFDDLSKMAATVVPSFPPSLHQLGFSSLMKYMRKLRTPPPLPRGTANIQWWGHWLERWLGRESDLFYVFVKHYHILATDFMQADASKKQRMCAPGMVLVHAQVLTNLDATIHRSTTHAAHDPAAVGAPSSFDDVLGDPDATATALPVPPTNAIRIMAENRLIMLIRDFLSERTADHPVARHMFAEAFNGLLQTAARGTSVYDHAACYTLLDFLEEALLILVRYEHIRGTEVRLINSEFWQSVCKRMISSQNTMTEIRLYSFLYTVWNTVVCDLGRKANLCLNLLLDPEIFESRFNHWCPMVRAYYMRLLCWRVGRYDGEPAHGDLQILETMVDRLQSTWSYYLFLRDQAEDEHKLAPPSNPCNPAPGRRLLIVRTDTQVVPGGSFMSFDGIIPNKPAPSPTQPAWRRHSTISQMPKQSTKVESARASSVDYAPETPEKGVGGFLRKIIGSRSRSKSQSRASPMPPSKTTPENAPPLPELPTITRAATEDTQFRGRPPRIDSLPKHLQPPTHRNFCFKFSLEYHAHNKPIPGPMRLFPPRLPLPAQHFLQANSSKVRMGSQRSAAEPTGESKARARYCGRALAEWAVIVLECQSFFERRKNEGVPSNKLVETPTLGVEVFRRPS